MHLEMRSEILRTNVMKEYNVLTKFSLQNEEMSAEDTQWHCFNSQYISNCL